MPDKTALLVPHKIKKPDLLKLFPNLSMKLGPGKKGTELQSRREDEEKAIKARWKGKGKT